MADDIPQGTDTVPVGQRKAPAEDKQQYTGEIRRTNTDGTEIGGFLIDKMGSRIATSLACPGWWLADGMHEAQHTAA